MDNATSGCLEEYDAVRPYGFCCAAAGQLQVRGLCACSCPLDWLAADSEAALEKALTWVKNHFGTPFFDYAALRTEIPAVYDWAGCVLVSEPTTVFLLPHAVRALTEETFGRYHAQMMRRAGRLARMLDESAGKRVLIVSSSRSPLVPMAYWRRLRDAFRENWPQVRFTLYVLAFCSGTEGRTEEDGLVVDRVRRDFDIKNDLSAAMPDWRYLDEARFPNSLSAADTERLNIERCRQADWELASVLQWWKRYFFFLRVSFRDKRRMVKLMRVAYSRGYLRFRDVSPSAGRRMVRFLRTRNPLWLFAVRIPGVAGAAGNREESL